MRGAIEIITPERAQELLDRAKPNRNIREVRAIEIAMDMEAGRWECNGETIIIAPNGRVLDGQHRLLACIISGIPFQTFISYDIPEKVFDTINGGRVRTAADILQTKGYTTTNITAAASRYSRNYISGGSLENSVPRLLVTNFVGAHPYINTICKIADSSGKMLPRTALGTVLFLANTNRSYEVEAGKFLEGIHTGINLQKGDPRLTFREWYLQEGQRTRKGAGIPTATAIGAVIRAWNAYVSGRSLTSIRGIDNVTRDTMPIIGFERVKFKDVPDIFTRTGAAESVKKAARPRQQDQLDMFETARAVAV